MARDLVPLTFSFKMWRKMTIMQNCLLLQVYGAGRKFDTSSQKFRLVLYKACVFCKCKSGVSISKLWTGKEDTCSLELPYAEDAGLLLARAQLRQPTQEELIGCAVGLPRLHHLPTQLHNLIYPRQRQERMNL